jgi:hypothetical protein
VPLNGLGVAADQLDEQEGNGYDQGSEGNENGQRTLSFSDDRHQRQRLHTAGRLY